MCGAAHCRRAVATWSGKSALPLRRTTVSPTRSPALCAAESTATASTSLMWPISRPVRGSCGEARGKGGKGALAASGRACRCRGGMRSGTVTLLCARCSHGEEGAASGREGAVRPGSGVVYGALPRTSLILSRLIVYCSMPRALSGSSSPVDVASELFRPPSDSFRIPITLGASPVACWIARLARASSSAKILACSDLGGRSMVSSIVVPCGQRGHGACSRG
eukprot:6497645-Prymnesium_polylepis.1